MPEFKKGLLIDTLKGNHRNNMKTHLLNMKYINTYPPSKAKAVK